jgi:hypothetical protein
MKKGGLSTIVVTLIIILFSIISVGIVWVIVRNIIQSGAEEANLSQFSLSAKIMNVLADNNSNNISLTVKRNAGQGDINAINFVFSTGTDTEVIMRNVSLKEMEQMKFDFHLNMSVSDLTSISIIPLINQDKNQILGIALDKYNLLGNVHSLQCIPTNCSTLGYACGNWNNGTCLGTLNCGMCPGLQTCDLNGICVSSCNPTNCSAEGYQCGSGYSNGSCSGDLNCGDCTSYGTGFSCNASGRCVDTTPPTRTSGAPSGTLPSGTTQANISLRIDEWNAICRYSTSAGTSYASMTNTLAGGGTLSHSRLITGLTNGQTYNYYVRCNDSAGNFNTNDYAISFSVAASCVPDCIGKECGSDGCSGTCPPGCGTGFSCNASGRCVSSSVPTTCRNNICESGENSANCAWDCGLIVNHTAVDQFNQIPVYWINKAKEEFIVHYAHTSHGSQLVYGLWNLTHILPTTYNFSQVNCNIPTQSNSLKFFIGQRNNDGSCSSYVYDEYFTPIGLNLTRNSLGNYSKLNISMYSWCCQLNAPSSPDVPTYLNAIANLTSEYPNVLFVYMTGNAQAWSGHHAYGDASGQWYKGDVAGWNRYQNNQNIRQYCIAHHKILYDFEDIDSWYNGEQAYGYYEGNFFTHEHEHYNINQEAHTSWENIDNKGKAVWWMMARLAGWDGAIT